MDRQYFTTFIEASSFAKKLSRETGQVVKFKREGSRFLVFINQDTSGPNSTSQSARRYGSDEDLWDEDLSVVQEGRPASISCRSISNDVISREDLKEKRRELAARARMLDRHERRPYLCSREKYYRSLSDSELKRHWNQRIEDDLDDDEKAILREVIREVEGITPSTDESAVSKLKL